MADIQLVIKIPESMYEGIMLDRVLDTTVIRILDEIKNGTPLPKGHGRLIDASNLLNKLYAYASFNDACELEDSLQTIIEADKAESEDNNAEGSYSNN